MKELILLFSAIIIAIAERPLFNGAVSADASNKLHEKRLLSQTKDKNANIVNLTLGTNFTLNVQVTMRGMVWINYTSPEGENWSIYQDVGDRV